MTDLLNCPFCGGDAEYHSDKGPTGEVYAWVGCNQCDAMSVHCDVRSMQPEETHPIDAWNARASDAEITRLTEALRAAEERADEGYQAAIADVVEWLGVQQHGRTSDNYPGYYARQIEQRFGKDA